MTLQDIINYSRKSILNDYTIPYAWHDDELVVYANESYMTITRDAKVLVDSSTAAVCQVATVAGTFDYALDSSVLYVTSAKLLSEELLTLNVAPTPSSWTAGATVTGGTSGKSCYIKTALTSTTYTIQNRTGAFTLGEILSDGTNSADQGTAYPTVADSSTSPRMLLKTTMLDMNRSVPNWRSGTREKPIRYLLDYRPDYITFYPAPDAVYTIALTVIRYPITAFSATSMSTQTPEIDSQFHHALIHGIAWQAFLKPGENTQNHKLSEYYYKLFRKQIADMKVRNNMYEANESTNGPLAAFM